MNLPEWAKAFSEECAAAGQPLDAAAMMMAIRSSTVPRPEMLRAIQRIRAEGLTAAALTNNWNDDGTNVLEQAFDVFLESSKLGMRKPDPRIYSLACERMGVEADAVVYLDDIGYNLKPARAMGMTTIKVVQAEPALAELTTHLGFSLA